MKFGVHLDKYDKMSRGGPAGSMPDPQQSSKPSSVCMDYNKGLRAKNAPTVNPMYTRKPGFFGMSEQLRNLARFIYQPGGNATTDVVLGRGRKDQNVRAEAYMVRCVTDQHKQSAAPSGVYALQCTKGTVSGQAEWSRVASLAADFRRNHRTTSRKYYDFFETRKLALLACNGCSYEEGLVSRNPLAAAAMVRGYSEAKGVCVRYAAASTPAERYMADCVDKQMKMRALPFGYYEATCDDGCCKGMAEYKRVSGLSAKFRATQYPAGFKEQSRYDAAKYARDNFGHGCNYEETYFNTYNAVAAAMRPTSARY